MQTFTHANRYGYTDIDPFEVIRHVSDRCIEVRAMDATLDPTWKPEMIPGGFFAHTVNNHEQRWTYASNEQNETRRVRLHKNGQWKDAHGSTYKPASEPRKFYDYNF